MCQLFLNGPPAAVFRDTNEDQAAFVSGYIQAKEIFL